MADNKNSKKPSISFTDIKNPALREEAEKQYRKMMEEEAKKALEEQAITNELLQEQNEIVKKAEAEKKELRKKQSDKSIEAIKELHNTITKESQTKEIKEKTSKQSLTRTKQEIPLTLIERLEKSNSVLGRSLADGINAGNRMFWGQIGEIPILGTIVETLRENAEDIRREKRRELEDRADEKEQTSSRLDSIKTSFVTNFKKLHDKLVINLSSMIAFTNKMLSPLSKVFGTLREFINTSKTNQRILMSLEKLSTKYEGVIKDFKVIYKNTTAKFKEVSTDIITGISLNLQSSILEPIKSGWGMFTEKFKETYQKGTSSLKDHFSGIKKSYEKLSDKVSGGFKWLAARNLITAILANAPMIALVGGFAFGIYQIITKLDDLWGMLKDFGNWIGEKIKDAFNWIKDGLIDLWSDLKLGLYKAIDLIPGIDMGNKIKEEEQFQKTREADKLKAFYETDAGKMKLLEDKVRENVKKKLEEDRQRQMQAMTGTSKQGAPIVVQSNNSRVSHVQSAPSAGRQYTMSPKVATAGFH